jgi:hypothetical protein
MESRDFVNLWDARQIADHLGLPYPFFASRMMELAIRRGVRRLPMPNQLKHDFDVSKADDLWHEHTTASLEHSVLPQYAAQKPRICWSG